jgi:sterol desaturase/sphingolipid hydroxylase (fatty acid hydroxylase superfamily)
MQFWLSEPGRLLVLIISCAFLWSLESVIPLFQDKSGRLRRALPNLVLTTILLLMNLLLSFCIAYLTSFTVGNKIGVFFLLNIPAWLGMILGVVALDLFTYWAHRLLHLFSFGWRFHRVHHSERTVNVTTAFRQHPGETIWRILWLAAAILVFGIPLWVVVVYLSLSSLNALMEHANIKFDGNFDRILRLLIVTPNMHKAHHSREQKETDSNYANIFSFWDRLFGSYTSQVDFRKLRYGLDGFDGTEKQSLLGLIKMPFTG